MPEFHQFGVDHLTVLAFMISVGLVLVLCTKRLRSMGDDRLVRFALAVGLVGNGVISWVYSLGLGFMSFPLQLCDLALFLIAWALIGKNRYVGELAFFWGLAGSSQAVLTPDIVQGFPSYWWITFFLGHCGVALSAVYLIVRGRVKLTTRSVWRVWIISNLYALVAILVNWRLGTNFGYLAAKPAHPSVLDYLGPWPYYIVSVSLLALVIFFICYLFSRMIDRLAGT